MSDNPEPASASSENEYSDDSINIEQTESSSDGHAKRHSNISNKSNYSATDDSSSESYYSDKENHKIKSNPQKNSSKNPENNQKNKQKKSEISNSDESPKYKKQNKTKNTNDRKSDSSPHHSRNHSSHYSSSHSNNKYDSDSASYSNQHHNNHSSDENTGDASLASLAKKKTGRLKIQRPKKKKHYRYEVVEETEKYESTDDEPDNLERAVNTRSQLANDADLKPTQEKSKCCLLI